VSIEQGIADDVLICEGTSRPNLISLGYEL